MRSNPPVANRLGFIAGIALSLNICAAGADVVAVVSARNPVTALSKSQAADIFLGKTSHFPDGSPAVPIDQAEGSAARDEFYVTVAGKSAAQLKAHWSKIIFTGRGQPPREASGNAEVRKRLAADPSAIGYIEKNSADASVKILLMQ